MTIRYCGVPISRRYLEALLDENKSFNDISNESLKNGVQITAKELLEWFYDLEPIDIDIDPETLERYLAAKTKEERNKINTI